MGFLVFIFSVMLLWGGEQEADANRLNEDFFLRCGKDLASVVSSPAHWQKRDALTVAALSGTTFLCFALDADIRREVLAKRTPDVEEGASFFSSFGDGGFLLGGLAALYLTGEMGKKDSLRRTSLLCLESLVTTTIFIWGAKFVLGRSRPSTGESSSTFRPFSFASGRTSFPSGHAASAFAVATAIAEETKAVPVDILAYSLASLVGVARIVQDKHWTSDVLVGSALGYFIARKICRLNRDKEETRARFSLHLSPGYKSLVVSYHF